jgi:hypothetical protein
MNEDVLYTLAQVGVTLAGFSGVVVAFRVQGAHKWAPMELRALWFLIGDSFLVLLFSLLPIPLSLAGWTDDLVWGVCSASLGTWFIIGNLLYLSGEAMDRSTHRRITVPIITPIFQGMGVVSFVMGVALWLSAFDLGVPRNQAFYVFGLMILLVYVAVEFLFFIGVISQQEQE